MMEMMVEYRKRQNHERFDKGGDAFEKILDAIDKRSRDFGKYLGQSKNASSRQKGKMLLEGGSHL